MANPNILQATTIAKKTRAFSGVTSETTLLDNAAASGKIVKVNSIRFSNSSGGSSASISLFLDGDEFFSRTISPSTSEVIVSGTQSFYLGEGQTLSYSCNSTTPDVTVTYTEIS